jgi:hypothetical protein
VHKVLDRNITFGKIRCPKKYVVTNLSNTQPVFIFFNRRYIQLSFNFRSKLGSSFFPGSVNFCHWFCMNSTFHFFWIIRDSFTKRNLLFTSIKTLS